MNTLRLNNAETELTLFVGCLDPATTQLELSEYFRQFDAQASCKLIMDFATKRSKQCGLVFCSTEALKADILRREHVLQGRVLRVSQAEAERKGKKVGQTYPIQISGLEPSTTVEALEEAFYDYPGLLSVRFVQGIHPKQKKVAILTFGEIESAKSILDSSHFKVGNRNCKVAEYIQKGQVTPKLSNSCPVGGEESSYQQPNTSSPIKTPWLLETLTFPSPACMQPRTQQPSQLSTQDRDATGRKVLSKLSLGSPFSPNPISVKPRETLQVPRGTYVHPVEVEEDNLFRIFCPVETPSLNTRSIKLRLSSESADTTEE